MASVWVRQVSTTSHGERGWLQTPAAAPLSLRTVPLVTHSSHASPQHHYGPWHHCRMTTEQLALTAARARTCRALVHCQVLCPHTQSRDESCVPRCCVGTETP